MHKDPCVNKVHCPCLKKLCTFQCVAFFLICTLELNLSYIQYCCYSEELKIMNKVFQAPWCFSVPVYVLIYKSRENTNIKNCSTLKDAMYIPQILKYTKFTTFFIASSDRYKIVVYISPSREFSYIPWWEWV